jgi:hypothetical protein
MRVGVIFQKVSEQAQLAWRLRAPMQLLADIIELQHAFRIGGLEVEKLSSAPCDPKDPEPLVLRTVIQWDGDAMFIVNPPLLQAEVDFTGLSREEIVDSHVVEVNRRLAPLRDVEALSGLAWSVALGATAIAQTAIVPWSHLLTLGWLTSHWALFAAEIGGASAPIGVRMLVGPIVRSILAGRFATLDRKMMERALRDIRPKA